MSSVIHGDARVAGTDTILAELLALRADLLAATSTASLADIDPGFRASAQNLLQYLALRRHDLRSLQPRLAALGLSSLGRAESHVLATLDAVIASLHRLAGRDWQPPADGASAVGFDRGRQLLAAHADALLGGARDGRDVHIMVTMPTEAAEDDTLVRDLLELGMDAMRINCSHDDAAAWARMIIHLRQAEAATGRSCRVVMDLGGPKLRTGPIAPGPAVLRLKPRRDEFGRVVKAASAWLVATGQKATAKAMVTVAGEPVLPVAAEWLARLREGDRIDLTDARGAARLFTVTRVTGAGCCIGIAKGTYLVPGLSLRHLAGPAVYETGIGDLPAKESRLVLRVGDSLLLTRDLAPGCPAEIDEDGVLLSPARIGCTIPEVFDDVRPGEPVFFDDGRIGGVIEEAGPRELRVRITEAARQGSRLRAGKGINLPQSRLRLGAITAQDLQDLDFVAQHADVVELSFASRAEDVTRLQQELARRGDRRPAIVLKIETQQGFANLPELLLAAMHAPCCGVMIARGDLAVEVGFERLAEVQEEILWVSEAAHVPVIWATQVLDSLAREGLPTRAEITDASMAQRAECVMLNKGPFVRDALRALDDILRRMQSHQDKKQSMLRELHVAHALEAVPATLRGAAETGVQA